MTRNVSHFLFFSSQQPKCKEKNEPKCTALSTHTPYSGVCRLCHVSNLLIFFSCWRNTFLPVKCNFSLQRINCCFQKVTKTMTSKRRWRPYFISLPNPLLGCACLVMLFKWLQSVYIDEEALPYSKKVSKGSFRHRIVASLFELSHSTSNQSKSVVCYCAC